MPKETISVPPSMGFIRSHIRSKLYRLTKQVLYFDAGEGCGTSTAEEISNSDFANCEGRVYGGGLYKMEPKELGNVFRREHCFSFAGSLC